MFLYQKVIDRSTLRQGFTIPVQYHAILNSTIEASILHGEKQAIKILLEGKEHDAQLINQGFNRDKYADHTDVVQIRYGENSALTKRLREIFSASWNYVETIKNLPENINRKFTIRVPKDQQEFLVLNTTDLPNVFVADCITCDDHQKLNDEIKHITEQDFEQTELLPKKSNKGSIGYGKSLVRIRHLDRTIGDTLKQLYDFRCQMTGERIGEQQEALCVEAHHIVPFTKSLNNDYSNIIILSPSYHRIVHKANPKFDKKTLSFVFPNGLVESVKLNKHL